MINTKEENSIEKRANSVALSMQLNLGKEIRLGMTIRLTDIICVTHKHKWIGQ